MDSGEEIIVGEGGRGVVGKDEVVWRMGLKHCIPGIC